MSLFIAFLIGLALGIVIAVPILLRHRRRLSEKDGRAAPAPRVEAARLNLPAASTLPDDARPRAPRAKATSNALARADRAQPAVKSEVLPNSDNISAPFTSALLSGVVPALLLRVATPQMPSQEPDVEISMGPQHPASLRMNVQHRAAALLQEGEPEQALAVIEPYLSDLQRIATAHPGSDDVQRSHPTSLALAQLKADIQWTIAARDQGSAGYAAAASALETLLVLRQDNATAMFRLAYSQLRQVDGQSDEMEKMGLLQSCIDRLTVIGTMDTELDPLHLGVLGEALCRQALLDVVVDEARLAEAEGTLRQALANAVDDDSEVAWWLQKLLAVPVPAMAPSVAQERLQESIELSRLGLKSSDCAIAQGRWQASLMQAELAHMRMDSLNKASNRLRLRALYSRYAPSMQSEQSPDVLAAWVDMLCALTSSMVGHAAIERYREIDDVLGRLSRVDSMGHLHAAAWVRMARSRLTIENEAGKRDLLARAWVILEPHLDRADANLRLQASTLALERAVLATESEAGRVLYTRALELARPLTVVPSLAVSALGCVLKALLAMGEDSERRVYARCLNVISPEDADSLCLLAQSSYRDGKFVEACRYLETAWLKRDKAWPEEYSDLWRDALDRWRDFDADDEAFQHNQRQWRHADHRRYR